jgi:hypothetical protein
MRKNHSTSKWADHYKDSRWQKKRLEIMERDNWTCRSCGASGEGVTLNVHHAYYKSGNKPWEYPQQDLVTWCEDCHKERHILNPDLLTAISYLKKEQYQGLIYMLYVAGMQEVFRLFHTNRPDEVCVSEEALIMLCKGLITQAEDSFADGQEKAGDE